MVRSHEYYCWPWLFHIVTISVQSWTFPGKLKNFHHITIDNSLTQFVYPFEFVPLNYYVLSIELVYLKGIYSNCCYEI